MRKNLLEEWKRYPFLGVALPLMAGIVTAEYICFPTTWKVIYPFLFMSFVITGLLVCYTSFRYRFLFGLFLYGFLFLAGGILCSLKQKSMQVVFPDSPGLYHVVLMTNPSPKRASVQCQAYILSFTAQDVSHPIGRTAILSFAKTPNAMHLKAGDRVSYYGRTLPPKKNTNPGMFDYAAYLRHQGICAQAYIPSYAWEKTVEASVFQADELPFSVKFVLFFRKTRNELLAPYQSGVNENTASVLSALTLGDVSALPQQLKEDYSIAGASHILALSGSHLAVIYAVLDLLFALCLYRWKAGRYIGKSLIVILIWGFVFLAGAQPSVIRAAVMYTLLVTASLLSRQSLSLNSLAVAAFFMLLADPFALFDVGFQLSFLAVLGILLFNAPLYKRLRTSSRSCNYVISILTVSLSVQLISFPLVLYYFSSFPLYFLLTNLLVVPVSSLVLLLALAGSMLVLFMNDLFLSVWFKEVLYWLVELQNEGVSLLAGLPCSSLYIPGVTKLVAACLYGIMLFLLCKKYFRPLTRWYAGLALSLVGAAFLMWQWVERRNISYLVFYDNRRCPAMHLVKGTRKGVLFPAWKDSVANGLSYIASTSWKTQGLASPEMVVPEDGILLLPECRVLLLKDKRWNVLQLRERLKIDYVWLCRGFYGSLSRPLSSFSVKKIVLDASLSESSRQFYRQECLRLRLPFHDMAEAGACKVFLSD